jgi:isocitrate lyase
MNTAERTLVNGKYDRRAETTRIEADWAENSRWQDVARTYTAEDVVRLRGSIKRDNTIAKLGAEKLWELLSTQQTSINAQGAQTGNQAVQHVNEGAQAIYLSGWQAIADQTTAETLYPDQSLYAINSVPSLVRRVNNAFERADQIQWKAGSTPDAADFIDYFAPIVADAEAHNGTALNAYELTKNMIRAGAAGVHFDDQLTSVKLRNHTGKVLMPTREVVQKLSAARLAADVEDVSTLIIARTTANATELLCSDSDAYDQSFLTGERTEDGFHCVRAGIEQAIARGLAYAPFADLLWLETAQPDPAAARKFAEAIRREHPQQLLAYNCSTADLDAAEIAELQRELSALGFQFQFIAQTETQSELVHHEPVHHEDMAA